MNLHHFQTIQPNLIMDDDHSNHKLMIIHHKYNYRDMQYFFLNRFYGISIKQDILNFDLPV